MPDDTGSPPLRARLRRALPDALRARDTVAVAALRSALGAIDNGEAVAPVEPGPMDGVIAGARPGLGAGEAARRELSEQDVAAIVGREVAERLDAAEGYAAAGRDDRATRLRAEAEVLARHLGEA